MTSSCKTEWKTYIDSRNTGNFDVIRASRVGDYNEASTFLSLLTSTHSGNIAKFKNADYDKLLAQAGRETNPAAVTADYNKMEQIIADRAPIAPIYQYTNGRLIKPWVKAIRSPTLKTWPTARRCISSNTESIYLSPRLMRGFILSTMQRRR